MLEYGIQTDNTVIVGPGWTCVADVLGSAHGGYGPQIFGRLVVRSEDDPEWKEI